MAYLILLAVVVWFFARRARRRNVLAGRIADRPVYSVEPPTRRQERSSRGTL